MVLKIQMKQTDIDLIYGNRYYEDDREIIEEYEDENPEVTLQNSKRVQNRNRKVNIERNRVRNNDKNRNSNRNSNKKVNKNRAAKRRKSYVALVLAASLVIFTFVACGKTDNSITNNGKTKIVLTTGFAKDEIFCIDKAKCTLPEAMVYLMNMKNHYENAFGDKIWQVSYEGVTLEDKLKNMVLAKLARIKALNIMAEQNEVTLSQDETTKAQKAAAEYYQSLSAVEVSELNVTQELICQMYEEYALADKVYEQLIANINPEISDDEARTITVQTIFIKTYTYNGDNEKVVFTDDAKKKALAKAKEALKKAKSGEDFNTLVAEYSEDSKDYYSFGKGTYNNAFEEAAFNLGTNEISDIVETEDGYYIIKCISTFDREETDRNKVKLIEQRRKEEFNRQYTDFVSGLARDMNDKLWDSVGFIENENVKTSTFFEIYNKFFGNSK